MNVVYVLSRVCVWEGDGMKKSATTQNQLMIPHFMQKHYHDYRRFGINYK